MIIVGASVFIVKDTEIFITNNHERSDDVEDTEEITIFDGQRC